MNYTVCPSPLVSVIVPVYNVEQWLSVCIESLILQSYENIEILLVDDGATDNSGQICEDYALKDSRIKLIHKKNGGLSDARNIGICNAHGEFITLVDSDDYIARVMIEHLIALQRESDADIVVCQSCRIDENGILLKKTQNRLCDTIIRGKENCMSAYLRGDAIGTVAWGKLYRTSSFVEIQYPIGKFHEDVYTTYKLIDKCQCIAVSSQPLYYYRQRNNSITQMQFSPKHLDAVWGKLEMATYVGQHYPALLKYAYADVVYAANQCLFRIMHSDSVSKEHLDFLQSIYRKYTFYYMSLKRPVKNNVFALLSWLNIKWIRCVPKMASLRHVLGTVTRKLRILIDSLVGYLIKWHYDVSGIRRLPSLKPYRGTEDPEFIVSLTSYGRRVKHVVYYTLVSLLKQSYLPERIILWLDTINWNEDNIPLRLKRLRSKGVEIRFCEDLKSYKKLVPTLAKFGGSAILTVDDDVIYTRNFLEAFWKAYQKDTTKIYCSIAVKPKRNSAIPSSILEPYETWEEFPRGLWDDRTFKLPIGVGGILYPPHTLSSEVLNKDLFTRLCPRADDIWFWIMAIKKGTRHVKLPIIKPLYSFDNIYQFFHKGSALADANVREAQNDVQIKNVISHFALEDAICNLIVKY